MVDAFMFGRLSELEEVDRNVGAVTLQDLERVARRYFDPGRRVEAIVRGTTLPGD